MAMKILLLLPFLGYCVMVSEVSQYGITWTFDQAHETGQYANGGYRVQGPPAVKSWFHSQTAPERPSRW
jgi:hypothetical protein